MQQKIEHVVIVVSQSRLDQLKKRFNTTSQAQFYIEQNIANVLGKKNASVTTTAIKAEAKKSFAEYESEHLSLTQAIKQVHSQLLGRIKFKEIDRDFLPHYIFTEKDLVVVIGQDGLVANTAKYVRGIPIIGINPDPSRYDGILLPFSASEFKQAFENIVSSKFRYRNITLAEAMLNDGQKLLAFNDFFIGPTSHVSARYKISFGLQSEQHSSSGIIISTGAGSTGWMSSIFNMVNGVLKTFDNNTIQNLQNLQWESEQLLFVVREPFVSKTSQAEITAGCIEKGKELILESFMPQNGIIFSDGIETDFLKFNSGTIATIGIAKEKAKLVVKE